MASSDSEDFDDLLSQAKAYAAQKQDQMAAQADSIHFEPDPDETEEILPSTPAASVSSLAPPKDKFGQMPSRFLSKKAYQKALPKHAGPGWFDMPAAPTDPTPELKREVAALKLAGAIDPKRFLKGEAKRDSGKLPEYFQFGHIVPSQHPASNDHRGPGKAGKKRSFVEDLVTDDQVKTYAKKKYLAIQEKNVSGGKNFYKRKQAARRK